VVCSLGAATAQCKEGKCVVAACTAGFGDCDGNPANGCEAELAKNAQHCGKCGNSCGAGLCDQGTCQVGPLFDTEGVIRELALSADTLFVLSDFTLRAYNKDTGAFARAVSPPAYLVGNATASQTSGYAAATVAGDGGVTLGADGGAIVATHQLLRIDAPPVCVFASGGIGALTAQGTDVYFAGLGAPGAVELSALDATSTCAIPKATSLAAGQDPVAFMSVDAERLYWLTTSGLLRRVKRQGGTVDNVVTGVSGAAGVRLFESFAFVSWSKGLWKLKTNAVCDALESCGGAEKIETESRGPFVLDGDVLYVRLGDDAKGYQIAKRGLGGEDRGSFKVPGRVTAIAADDKSIFFAVLGRVYKVTK